MKKNNSPSDKILNFCILKKMEHTKRKKKQLKKSKKTKK